MFEEEKKFIEDYNKMAYEKFDHLMQADKKITDDVNQVDKMVKALKKDYTPKLYQSTIHNLYTAIIFSYSKIGVFSLNEDLAIKTGDWKHSIEVTYKAYPEFNKYYAAQVKAFEKKYKLKAQDFFPSYKKELYPVPHNIFKRPSDTEKILYKLDKMLDENGLNENKNLYITRNQMIEMYKTAPDFPALCCDETMLTVNKNDNTFEFHPDGYSARMEKLLFRYAEPLIKGIFDLLNNKLQ